MDKKEDKKEIWKIWNWIKGHLLFLFLSIGIGLVFGNIYSVLSANTSPTAAVASKNIPASDPHIPNVEASIPAASSASGEVAQNTPASNPNVSKDNGNNITLRPYLNIFGLIGIYIILMVIIYYFMHRKPTDSSFSDMDSFKKDFQELKNLVKNQSKNLNQNDKDIIDDGTQLEYRKIKTKEVRKYGSKKN